MSISYVGAWGCVMQRHSHLFRPIREVSSCHLQRQGCLAAV